MHVYSTLLTLALGLDAALSQPHGHHARHAKRDIDFNRRDIYSNVDWSKIDWTKVDYSGGQGQAQGQAPAAPAPAPSPAAVVQQPSAPVVEQHNTDTTPSTSDTKSAGGSKRGLCYDFQTPSLSAFSAYAGKSVSWAWNWDSSPWKIIDGLSYAPTLHSLKPEATGPWAANAKKAIDSAKGGPAYLLGFNEPDIADQANLSPGAAVSAWKQYMTPLAGGNVKFGSPQVSNGVGTNPATGQAYGLEWLKQFVAACTGCQIDFYVVHWYGCTDGCSIDTDAQAFKTFIGQAKAFAGGKKLWITEFGTHNADQAGFIKEVLPFLDGEDAVERYSYFMVKDGDLLSGNGLSAAGSAYVS